MNQKECKIMITGHRPDKLFGYDIHTESYAPLRQQISRLLGYAIENHEFVSCISGMALGADMIFAEEALKLKLDLHAYIPFAEQSRVWTPPDRTLWQKLLDQAAYVHTSGKLEKGTKSEIVALLHKRNRDMVDACDLVIAVWNGDTSGGTYSCLQYAKTQNKRIVIIDPKTNKVTLSGGKES